MGLELLLLPMVFVPILLGFLPIFIKSIKKINIVMIAISLVELALCLFFMFSAKDYQDSITTINWFSGFGISFKINGLGILQAVAASVIWIGASVFSLEYFEHEPQNLRRYYALFSVTFGATLGMFLAYDLFTLFIFFEVMSFASYVLVVHSQNQESTAAGNSYLTIAILGGLVVLMGIFILNAMTGTLVIDELMEACKPYYSNITLLIAGFMIFFGFAAKSGIFPINGWLPKTYTAAPAPVSTTLSGILSKCGIYGVIIVTTRILQGNVAWASFVLLAGVLTMIIGAFFAFLSTNLKETLAYSSMSQIGFITIGIAMTQLLGEHGTIAAYGTVLHMINHTLIKLVLFTCAGIIYKNAHSLDLNKLRGYGRGKPLLTICFGTAALGIMGVPFFNGYISKTLLHEAIVEKIWLFESYTTAAKMLQLTEAIFLLSGGLTVAYMVKLFVCLFVEKPKEEISRVAKPYITIQTGVLLSIVSGMIFIFGVFPVQTLEKIAGTAADFMGVHTMTQSVKYFSVTNIKGAAISITIGIILYFVIARVTVATKVNGYINPWNKQVSVENLVWQPLLFKILPCIFGLIGRIIDKSGEIVIFVVRKLFVRTSKIPKSFFNRKKEAGDEEIPSPTISITDSLSYSFLLFGIGFVFTLVYLLFSQF